MQTIKNRQPIHININNRGKLRRIIREKQLVSTIDNSQLIIAPPSDPETASSSLQKHKHNFFLRKQTLKTRKEGPSQR